MLSRVLKVVAFFFIGAVALGAIIGSVNDATESASPTCKSDWTRCKDNRELVNDWSGRINATTQCRSAAMKLAKYGDPKIPYTFPFSTFYPAEKSVETGKLTLVEKNAQF